jgi:uncharacterized membrane protein (DUF373 family)
MPQKSPAEADQTRTIVARLFTWVEDVVYVGLGLLLAISAIVLLVSAGVSFAQEVRQAALAAAIVNVLDRLLLVLLIVEVLYTIQVSFREHTLVPEPFLIVSLIAVTRRVLVITAEIPSIQDKGPDAFYASMLELGVLTFMILALAVSLLMLRSRHPEAVASRA